MTDITRFLSLLIEVWTKYFFPSAATSTPYWSADWKKRSSGWRWASNNRGGMRLRVVSTSVSTE